MQVKAADDKQPQLDALTALAARPGLDPETRRRIEREIQNMRAGERAERDAANEIGFHYGTSGNFVTVHDLRLEVGHRVAQIDHLIITRVLDIWLCESKSFSEGVAVNEHGEWSRFHGGRAYGMASPVEQNRHHVIVLRDVFQQGLVPLPRRLGIPLRPRLKSLVLVSKNARISRPKGKAAARVDGLETVIKADQLAATIGRAIDKMPATDIAKAVRTETMLRLARDLAALHRPAAVDWAARFGLAAQAPDEAVADLEGTPTSKPTRDPRAICEDCGRRISDKVAAYLLANAERFAGRTLCYDCQRKSRRAKASAVVTDPSAAIRSESP